MTAAISMSSELASATAGFAQMCTAPDDGTVWSELGLAYNAPCGAYMSQFLAEAAP